MRNGLIYYYKHKNYYTAAYVICLHHQNFLGEVLAIYSSLTLQPHLQPCCHVAISNLSNLSNSKSSTCQGRPLASSGVQWL